MRQTAESLMISVILNTKDPDQAISVGVKPEFFGAYRDEYEWVNRYHREYGTVPTSEELVAKFPDFPRIDREIVDPRQVGQEISRNYARKVMLKSLTEATQLIESGDIEEAYSLVGKLKYEAFTSKPENLLAVDNFLDDYDTPVNGIPYPWPTLQKVTQGIQREQLVYFAARPANGKSMFLVDMASYAAMLGFKVMFYSLEMSKRELQVRSHANIGNRLKWGDEIDSFAMLHRRYPRDKYQLLLREIKENTSGELHILDQSSGKISPDTIRSRIDDYDLTFIDYVGLMSTSKGSRSIEDWRAAAEISNELKSVAKEKKGRIVAAAQINREGDTDGRPTAPKMKSLGGTDAYVQDADTLITMARIRGGHAAALSVEKNRSGDSGVKFYTKFIANQGDFNEVSREEAEDLCDRLDD